MTENGDSSGGLSKAAGDLAKEAYKDAIKPAAQELAKGALIVAKAVNAALMPLEALVWGADQIKEFLRERVGKKLEGVAPENIQIPKPHIGVPVIDALRYTGNEPDLAELYANLLANSMDRETAYKAHPSFVDMIKNLSPDEARILRYFAQNAPRFMYPVIDIRRVRKDQKHIFQVADRHLSMIGCDAGCAYADLTPTYLDNLSRLGLVEVDSYSLTEEKAYDAILSQQYVVDRVATIDKDSTHESKIEKLRLAVTNLGKQFIDACVIDKASK